MRIWAISDSHSFHSQYIVPDGIDVVCHTGDATNYRDQYRNHGEFLDFVRWYAEVPVQHKIYVPGNHDSFIYHNQKEAKQILKDHGIIFLHKESIEINGVNFYGDGTSPTFGDWYFMCKRETINRHWELIPTNTNVLLTHTPPKGILDLAEDRDYNLEMCGCSALRKRIEQLPELLLHCFGHVHNNKDIVNIGTRELDDVIYSNAAGVKDGKFDLGIIHQGNILEL